MYDYLQFYVLGNEVTAVALPFMAEDVIKDWNTLCRIMIRTMPKEFTRDEWGYLISFLDRQNLVQPWARTFGTPIAHPDKPVSYLARPRGNIALWLPNNVSMLGPLMLVLISLSGNPVRIKAGSRSNDLTYVFCRFASQHLPPGALKNYLEARVIIACFDKSDSRHQEMAAGSRVRIVFGSDSAARVIDSLPHPIDSIGLYFIDRQSEAWVEEGCLDDNLVSTLIKVFAIYGQAGCTSPRKVVLINGTREGAVELKNHLVKAWPKVITRQPAQHIASDNVMARQWASALGWEAELTPGHGAVIAVGSNQTTLFSSLMSLPIVWGSLEDAVASLPGNIQTIGQSLKKEPGCLLVALAGTAVKRFVPLSLMHHFGPVWDGYAFWRHLFEQVEVIL